MPMFESIRYLNFKVLRDATLQLGPLTLLVGPNGSGKSTAIQGLQLAAQRQGYDYEKVRSLGVTDAPKLFIVFGDPREECELTLDRGNWSTDWLGGNGGRMSQRLSATRFFTLDPIVLGTPVGLWPNVELGPNGQNFAGVVDRLRDETPERFERLNRDVANWLPEFDRILFVTPTQGTREVLLRVAKSQKAIRASELSHGTLFALALLTLANLPAPPPFVAIEEPDRGVHPRMLRRVQDALYRLAFPSEYDESRSPVQVVVTTHSPFLLDLFRDHPEQIVIAERKRDGAEFSRLVERADVAALLGDASLGDLWYSGILGGVPSES